ncbi:transcription factor bHLH100 [Lactuca sativa]|uniref:transcription factor bHLH100 n=1 Tax=Lactuca sativa TaxID=4236 RepID=UPI000CADDFF7|nr:transcription factor bHLH100 [Lactuca sativa]
MLALSSPLFSTPYGWPLADNFSKVCGDPDSTQSFLEFPSSDQIQLDFTPENSSSFGGAVNRGKGDGMNVVKKLNHNASERDRRKKVNNLYESLRSVLPMSNDRKKKVSIPGIVSRAVKYIPELQKEVETLLHKKEKLWSYSSSTENIYIKKQSAKDAIIDEKSSIVSSVSVLSEKEAVIQLISSTKSSVKNKDIVFLSKVLEKLEEEEDGFILLNATTFKCVGEGMLLNTIHFQVQGNNKIDAQKMKEKLRSFQQQ